MPPASLSIHHLGPDDLPLLRAMLVVFGDVFEEQETYTGHPADADYLRSLLADRTFIALAAVLPGAGLPRAELPGAEVVGALVAYELRKFEQRRSEIYIYDLAVAEAHRRRGIATLLLRTVTGLAANRGAHAVFVQADPVDAPAVALYTKLGTREDVCHFDLDLPRHNG